MMSGTPQVLDILRGEATKTSPSLFGAVGTVYSGEGIELVWVSKQEERIDPDWFSTEPLTCCWSSRVSYASSSLTGSIAS